MMMKALVTAVLALTVAACNGDARKDEGAGKASGEVLPGSASDAMIPLDQVKSQAPLAPKVESADKKKAEGAEKDEAAEPAEAVEAPPVEAPPAAGE